MIKPGCPISYTKGLYDKMRITTKKKRGKCHITVNNKCRYYWKVPAVFIIAELTIIEEILSKVAGFSFLYAGLTVTG